MIWGDLNLIFLNSFSYFQGNGIGNLLSIWDQYGLFSYILPFLLIFSLVFGILSSMKLFGENRAVSAIIALSVGLMALQFETVPIFFSSLFPNFAVGISIILVLLILVGFFVDPQKSGLMYVFLGIGAIVAISVFINTAQDTGFESGYWWYANWEAVAGVVILIIVIAVIVGTGVKREHKDYVLAPWRPK